MEKFHSKSDLINARAQKTHRARMAEGEQSCIGIHIQTANLFIKWGQSVPGVFGYYFSDFGYVVKA